MPLNVDTSSEFGARVARRLQEEQIAWLTTVGKDGTPQPNPVWFHWDGTNFLIFSEPETGKVRHIKAAPRASLNFPTGPGGDDVVVFVGNAEIAASLPPESRMREYFAKYAEGIKHLGMTQEALIEKFHTVIHVTPDKVRGF